MEVSSELWGTLPRKISSIQGHHHQAENFPSICSSIRGLLKASATLATKVSWGERAPSGMDGEEDCSYGGSGWAEKGKELGGFEAPSATMRCTGPDSEEEGVVVRGAKRLNNVGGWWGEGIRFIEKRGRWWGVTVRARIFT